MTRWTHPGLLALLLAACSDDTPSSTSGPASTSGLNFGGAGSGGSAGSASAQAGKGGGGGKAGSAGSAGSAGAALAGKGGSAQAGSDGGAGSAGEPPEPICAVPPKQGEFYALSADNIVDVDPVPMCKYRGKVILVVNVASKCGYTPQYAPLEATYAKYADKGFVILGFPCNQFGSQEPGSDQQILDFCTETYKVNFPMFSKIDVNGAKEHPIYTWLKAQPGGAGDIPWNFTKFLLSREGKLVKRIPTATTPDDPSVIALIEAELAKPPPPLAGVDRAAAPINPAPSAPPYWTADKCARMMDP